MKKFLLVGHGGCYNRGCEAIVRSTICLLRKEFGSVKITLSSFDYENEKHVDFGNNVTVIPAISRELWKRFSKDWVLRQFFRIFAKERILELECSPIIGHLKNTDAVLSVGGDNYTVDYGEYSYFLNLHKLAKRFRKKIIIWAASIGPFPENDALKEIVKELKEADLITIRETKSFEYLKSIGINKNVRLVADPAFLLIPDEKSTECIFKSIDAPILGFNISPILAKYSNGLTNDDIIRESILFLRKVIENMKFYVLLIPHVTKNTGSNNDYTFMERIYDGLKDTKMVVRISPKYNAMQMKSIISKCRFFIGARTHSTIAALSTGVPTLSIGYSVKATGINEDLFGHNDFLLDVKNLSLKSLLDKFMKLYSAEHEIKNILLIQIPKAKELAYKNIEYLKKLCQK